MDNLGKAKAGKFYQILGYSENVAIKIKRRLLELGLTVGQTVKIARKSLLGKAYLLEVRGYSLSMRRNLASFILVRLA